MDRMEQGDGFEADEALDLAEPVNEPPMLFGVDERRMHVRAYNHWVALLDGRSYPCLDDIDPENVADFADNSVLLDFRDDPMRPILAYVGTALCEECGFDPTMRTVRDVPSRSLLSRLTDHYLEIISNRAPIGFEAEFINQQGSTILYRGILMPLSSDNDRIDAAYGVINWKELADTDTAAELMREMDQSLSEAGSMAALGPVWADGPLAEALALDGALLPMKGDEERIPPLVDGLADPQRNYLRTLPPVARLRLAHLATDEDFVLLLARHEGEGEVAVIDVVTGQPRLVEQAVRRVAACRAGTSGS